ncbi:MAG TPA: FAD-linked oxidase C-terminal domain-containing protein [Dissulfurispiraceae bacterium]|nr:FAD-linked oxidase C-terminal domain-containing protein [Dissulfurispiraceae bacterium]
MKRSSNISGVEISSEYEDLICYGFDSSIVDEGLPRAVAWPKNAEDVVKIVKYADEQDLKIIPRGAGTGMAGASVPNREDSIVLSFEKMRMILDIDTNNMTAVVEPGTVNGRLQRELERLGFFYPPDPASLNICTLGGNVATNAGGPRAVKYGVTRDYVLELEAVLPDGSLVTLGGRTHKRVVGYDLKQLLIGAEGTLAVVTKIRLRILPQPEDIVTLLIQFRSMDMAAEAVSRIITSRIIPRTLEFLDSSAIKVIEQYKPTGLPTNVDALLLVELDGHATTIQKEAEKVIAICRDLGGESEMAADKLAREKLWEARRSISPALYHLKPNKINEDIVVPKDKIPIVLTKLHQFSEESGIIIVSFGHAGDGNIHVNVMADKNNTEEYSKGLALIKKIFDLTLSVGGSISGEHGIGLAKLPYIDMEIKKREMQLMRDIKRLIDPKNMMNPGKIFA